MLEFLSLDVFSSEANPTLFLPTLKAAFLVAITSASRVSEIAALVAKEPFLTFYKDRIVLIPMLGFTPKVASKFHLRREIVLPSFTASGETTSQSLDVGQALRDYLQASGPVRQSDHLLIFLFGARKDKAASKRVVTSWLVKLITFAYWYNIMDPPGFCPIKRVRWQPPGGQWLESRWNRSAGQLLGRPQTPFIAHYCIEPVVLTCV